MKLPVVIVYVIATSIVVGGEMRIRGKVRKRYTTHRRHRDILPPCHFNETIIDDEWSLMEAIGKSKYIFTAKVLNVKKFRSVDEIKGKRSNLYKVHLRRVLKGDLSEMRMFVKVEGPFDETLSGSTVMVERPRARESCAPAPRPRLSAIFLSDGVFNDALRGPAPRMRLLTDPVPLTLYHLDRINAAVKEAECQKRWKRIRDCYKKAIRLRQFKSGSARSNDKPIRFEKELEFLKPYLQNKPQTSNLDSSEENDLNTDTDTNLSVASPSRPESQLSSHSDTTRKKSQPLSQMLFAQYLENKKTEEDPTDTFFLSMSKTVKRMPIQMQALLKRQILLLVTDAEIKVASNEMCTFQPDTSIINSMQANTSSSIGYTTELRTESESLQLQSNSTNCNSNCNTYKMQPNTGYYTTQLPTTTPSDTYSMQPNTSTSPNQFANSTSSRYRMEDLDLPPSPYIPLPIGTTTTRQHRDGDNDGTGDGTGTGRDGSPKNY